MTTHTFAGYRKVPSRRGGLKSPQCSCGWEGRASHAGERDDQFATHKAEAEAEGR